MTRFLFEKRKFLLAIAVASLIVGVTAGVWRSARTRQEERAAALFSSPTQQKEAFQLTEEEIADLVRPALVFVRHRARGEAKVPAFTIATSTKTVTFDKKIVRTIPIDYEFSATGVLIHPSGYILAPASAVSEDAVFYAAIRELTTLAAEKALAPGKSTDTPETRKVLTDDVLLREFRHIMATSTFTVTTDLRIIGRGEYEGDVGFSARVIATEPEFFSGRDAAVAKIDERDLPALPIAEDELLPVGRPVFLAGFEKASDGATGPFTLRHGVIRTSEAARYTIDGDGRAVSAGGVVLDAAAAVHAVILPRADQAQTEIIAIPVAASTDIRASLTLHHEAGRYYKHLLLGIRALRDKRCIEATAELEATKNTNRAFLPAETIKKYSDECARIISAGESIDARLSGVLGFFDAMGPLIWVLAGILILGAGGITMVVVIVRAKRHGIPEEAREVLPDTSDPSKKGLELNDNETLISRGDFVERRRPAYTAFLTKRTEEKQKIAHTDAELQAIKYAKDQRKAGFSDEQISHALASAGWQKEAVEKILILSRVE